jgi:hypothetical protein
MSASIRTAAASGAAFVALAAAPCGAQAALESRLDGLAVYDTDRNLTWLADANAIAGTAFDDGFRSNDGLVTWASAVAWVDSLDVGGFTDWRLPRTLVPDASCHYAELAGDRGCTGSEMGHLYHHELGGTVYAPADRPPDDGIRASGDPDLALFRNIRSRPGGGGIYWAAESWNAANARGFNFNHGLQYWVLNKAHQHFAWAVRDGDVGVGVAPIPEPSTWALLLAGLAGIGGVAARRRDAGSRADAR